MLRFLKLGVPLALLLPLCAGAGEINLSVESGLAGDSNYFDSTNSGQKKAELSYLVTPLIEYSDQRKLWTWGLRFRPDYEVLLGQKGSDTFSYSYGGNLSYRMDLRTTMTLTAGGFSTESLGRLQTVEGSNGEDLGLDPNYNRRRREGMNIGMGVTHTFTPRWTAAANFRFGNFRSHSSQDFESDSYNAATNLSYQLSSRSILAFGGTFSRSDFKGTSTQSASVTDSYNVFGRWGYQLDPTLTFSVQAGPAYITSKNDNQFQAQFINVVQYPFRSSSGDVFPIDVRSCPTLDDGTPFLNDSCDVFGATADPGLFRSIAAIPAVPVDSGANNRSTYFAVASLTKEWNRADSTISYTRSESTSAGASRTTINDTVRFRVNWSPILRWGLSLQATWRQQESATTQVQNVLGLTEFFDPVACSGDPLPCAESLGIASIEFKDALKVTTYNFSANVSRQIGEHGSISGRFTYRIQESTGSFFRPDQNYDNFRVGLRFRYYFRPFKV